MISVYRYACSRICSVLSRHIKVFPEQVTKQIRLGSSSSSTRWKARQGRDAFTRDAKVQGLKSRAAFKLLEINQKYKLFKPKQTVIDLGFAPGSWSQVAIDRVSPGGRVVGIDIIPAQPPKGVSTIQGNFLSPAIQAEVRAYVQDADRGRARQKSDSTQSHPSGHNEEVQVLEPGYVERERQASLETTATGDAAEVTQPQRAQNVENHLDNGKSLKERDRLAGRVVDVVLSDMSAPWEQTTGFSQRSMTEPYRRMMNTSGNNFKDHIGSMDLCMAALSFCFSTLRTGGHFVCKFYNGGEDKALETRLKALFEKVHREKPDASRKDSKEAFFVALRRKELAIEADVLKEID